LAEAIAHRFICTHRLLLAEFLPVINSIKVTFFFAIVKIKNLKEKIFVLLKF